MVRQKIGNFLVSKGVLSLKEVATALKEQQKTGKKLGEVLVDMGFVKEEQMLMLLGEFFGMKLFPINEVDMNPELTDMIPSLMASKHNIVPVALRENTLLVACNEPIKNIILENLKRITNKKIQPVLMKSSEITEIIQQNYQLDTTPIVVEEQTTAEEPDYAVKLVESMIIRSIMERASDLHLEPDDEGLRVRMRVDGHLKTVEVYPSNVAAQVISRLKILGNMNIAEKRSPQDGGFMFSQENGASASIRISILPSAKGEKAVLRIFSLKNKQLKLEDIGMEKEIMASFREILQLPHGLILVTGPTGSGKTFTLYSALKFLINDKVNIITIEDPVELQMNRITQVQVDENSRKLTFSSTLRAVLRQDPDVVMVGEIRDTETARLALQAALTGHLVLSTLHTNDAVSAIDRLIDMGCERFLVSSALRGVVAQRLIRIVCPNCREKYIPTSAELETLGIEPDSEEAFYSSKGCVYCNGTGYKGRSGIFELLVINRELQKMIAAGIDTADIKEYLKDHMHTLREDGIMKIRNGIATFTDILKATMDL
ncbi:type II secretory pathway, ATpase PulE/Tfp [Clostridium aceticum]|uniref:Type II secretory pathway, ATpase PulE/Tfp n=1 Tax=Clostridium aceticum TaxID=84022 RepID=A0A0D8I9K6_9CLOT|nr:GspE/PulE family protein [Clostridium aceticum]AKL96351.1 type II secretory pathway, ATpase PulE/Tfp [Clostridium aceticum]KJF26938.1 secretion system protein E [Clostridium aceticum]